MTVTIFFSFSNRFYRFLVRPSNLLNRQH